ncbi:MAG TPA: ATP-binding protein [Pseudomonadota bacterium]|nr:ATP-binding protein [Pseudomonadota bacterium]
MQADAPRDLAALRKLLGHLLPTATELAEFCRRHFPGTLGEGEPAPPRAALEARLLARATVAEVRYRLTREAPAAVAHHTDYALQVAAPLAPRPLCSVPRPRDPSFTGRAEQLGRLRGMLARCRTAVITGPAGVGKTALCSELVYRTASEYAVACVTGGATPDVLRTGLGELARQLHEHGFLTLPAPAEPDLEALRDFLCGRVDWLLVVDDLCSLAVLERMLGPGPPAGRLLWTTAEPVPAGPAVLELGPLTDAESLQLLAQRSERHKLLPGERAAVQRLALGLGYWPAALCMVADAVRLSGSTWTAALSQHAAGPASEASDGR